MKPYKSSPAAVLFFTLELLEDLQMLMHHPIILQSSIYRQTIKFNLNPPHTAIYTFHVFKFHLYDKILGLLIILTIVFNTVLDLSFHPSVHLYPPNIHSETIVYQVLSENWRYKSNKTPSLSIQNIHSNDREKYMSNDNCYYTEWLSKSV